MSGVPAKRRTGTTHGALDQMPIVLTYARVSSDEQADEGRSIPTQLRECRGYNGRQDGWVAGDEFIDVESGTRTDRDGYQRMLHGVRGLVLGRRRVVVTVAKIDRLGRNLAESIRAWDELVKLGVEIHSYRDGGRMAEMHYNLLCVFAQEESRRIGERVRAAWSYFEAGGWHKPGRPAWGFQYRTATTVERGAGSPTVVLEPHPTESAYAAEMWTRYADGEGVEGILRWIARLPDVARGSRTLSSGTVRMLLRSPVYIGRLGGPHDLAACVEAGDHCEILDLPPAKWSPLVDDETWTAAHRQYRQASRLPAQASGEYLLTGLMRCPDCSARMIGHCSPDPNAPHRRRYVCSGRRLRVADGRDKPCFRTIPARTLDDAVTETVREIIGHAADPTLRAKLRASIERHERQAARTTDDGAGQISRLESELARARKMLSVASQKFFADEISRTAYDVTSADLTEQIDTITTEMDRLRNRAGARPAPVPMGTVLRVVDGYAASLATTEVPAWRVVLSDLFESVRPVRIGYGKYEAGIELTAFGRGLLGYICDVAPSPNLDAVLRLGKTNHQTTSSLLRRAAARTA